MSKIFLFGAALALVGAGCAGTPSPVQTDTGGSAGASLQVPVPGFEEVEEAVEGIEAVETVEALEGDAGTESDAVSDEESSQQAQAEPESVLVTVVAKAWEFEPSTIRVKEGQRVDLQIVSIDVTHGFNLAAFGVNETLEPGKTMRASFVADK